MQDGFITKLNRSTQIVDVGLIGIEELGRNLLVIINDRDPLVNQTDNFLLQFLIFTKDAIKERLQQNSCLLLEHGGIECLEILIKPLLGSIHTAETEIH